MSSMYLNTTICKRAADAVQGRVQGWRRNHPPGATTLSHHLVERVLQLRFFWVFRAEEEEAFTTAQGWAGPGWADLILTYLFFSRESQYLASSSGDLLDDWAILVTALLLMKRPHAWGGANTHTQGQKVCSDSSFRLLFRSPTLSRAATKPASLLKADMTSALYFLWTSRVVCTYTLGSWKEKVDELSREAALDLCPAEAGLR